MSTTPFVLAASAEMLFVDLPVADRVRAIHDAGFAVEIWDWRGHDLDVLEALAADGVRFTSMTGYTTGTLADEAGADELLRTAAESVAVSRRLGAPSLNLHGTGLDGRGLPVVPAHEVTPQMWDTARRTLGRIAELGEREGVTFVLENLNTAVDHPRTPFARAADTLDLVRGVDSSHLRLNLDLYHAQIGEGNLIELCREALPWVAEVQVADVPGRCEPGTGEIRYAGVAGALADAGFTGVVGLEAFASADPAAALAAFREAFTVD
ncbi:TIM barrel protein [Phycicoccus avicenniae]|uniref:TIM barrel protein n=1 Tax=Phycicoccus avicenniae TaxID=2828860 RepID=UPI003D27B9BD